MVEDVVVLAVVDGVEVVLMLLDVFGAEDIIESGSGVCLGVG